VVLSNGTGVKGTRVDGATASISSEEFGKGGVEVVGNEGGDDVFVAVGVKVQEPLRVRRAQDDFGGE